MPQRDWTERLNLALYAGFLGAMFAWLFLPGGHLAVAVPIGVIVGAAVYVRQV